MTDQIATGVVTLGEDFEQHRIRGFVYHAVGKGIDPNIDIPLASHVKDNLWQGGCKDGVVLPDGFKHVVSLYKWERYQRPQGCELHEFTMYDSLEQGTEQALDIADLVLECLDDGPTLVHCQAGLNRSGMVAALTLVKLGFAPADAIDLLRKGRSPLVLVNESFEEFVLSQVAA
jgi:protein-tyrosine phosphatase